MRTVHKYQLDFNVPVTVEMSPWNARPIYGGFDGKGIPCLWFEVKPEMAPIKRTFGILGTGFAIPDGWEHCWSFRDGPFIWHIYEDKT